MSSILNDHPDIEEALNTGYPRKVSRYKYKKLHKNACDVCERFEAEVKFHNTKLCSECAKEESIELI